MDYDSSDTMNGGSSNPLITKMNTMKLLYQHYLIKSLLTLRRGGLYWVVCYVCLWFVLQWPKAGM